MTLGTHAITGAAVASLIPTHPIIAFAAGFASHFLADAIPHYDYPIYSDAIHPKKSGAPMQIDGAFSIDVIHFSLDAAIGIAISVIAFSTPLTLPVILLGALGGILPDPLQFVSKKIPYEPLTSLQKFHQWIHASWKLRETGYLWTGIVSQLVFVIGVICVAKIIASN